MVEFEHRNDQPYYKSIVFIPCLPSSPVGDVGGSKGGLAKI